MRNRGFTLIELLVVIIIIGLLLTLLFPALTNIWQLVLMTKCQRNLQVIFQAQNAWRAERGSLTFAGEAGWQGLLMPYVENQQSVFTCPGSPRWDETLAGSAAGGDVTTGGVTISPQAPVMGFKIIAGPSATYDGEGIGGLGPSDYPVFIPLDPSNVFVEKYPQADGSIRWELDDGEQPRGTPKHADDIFVTIYYKDGMPYKAIKPKENATSSANEYTYQFIVNEKIICDDWTPEPVGKEFNIPGSSSLTDYGLSKGTYKVLAGKVNRVDPAQFLILDYPKPIADYNDELGDNDTWDQFFITDPVQWEKTRKNGGFMWVDPSAAWQFYQALRHFGKANVLFCDGSVKALGPEDLFVTNPAWYYAGP